MQAQHLFQKLRGYQAVVGTLTAVLLLGPGGAGCAPRAFPAEFDQVARAVATSITDQALWTNVTGRVDGQVIEPGVLGYAGVLYVAGAKLSGVSGQVGLAGTGTGAGVQSPAAQEAIRDILRREGVPEEVIRRIVPSLVAPVFTPVP